MPAGRAGERRKDREEYRELWRGTQRQLDPLAGTVVQLAAKMDLIESLVSAIDELIRRQDAILAVDSACALPRQMQ